MKETILKVLENYKGSQANLDSKVLREMLADEIVDGLHKKYRVTETDLDNMSNIPPSYPGWLEDPDLDK